MGTESCAVVGRREGKRCGVRRSPVVCEGWEDVEGERGGRWDDDEGDDEGVVVWRVCGSLNHSCPTSRIADCEHQTLGNVGIGPVRTIAPNLHAENDGHWGVSAILRNPEGQATGGRTESRESAEALCRLQEKQNSALGDAAATREPEGKNMADEERRG